MATILIRLTGAEKYAVLARKLRAAGNGDLQKELTRNLHVRGRPAIVAVRDAVRGVEVTSSGGGGTKSTGLRNRIAAATTLSVTGRGIRIRVVGSRVDPVYGRSLSRLMDGHRPWVHPVYGNQENQEVQQGQEYFRNTLMGYADDFRKGCEDAMDEIAARIEG